MAKSVIGEEKAEIASNKPEFDLKVDDNLLSSTPAQQDTTNAISTPTEEVQFGISNPTDSTSVMSEQDKLLKRQQEIENLAVERASTSTQSQASTSAESSETPEAFAPLGKIANEIEADQTMNNMEN